MLGPSRPLGLKTCPIRVNRLSVLGEHTCFSSLDWVCLLLRLLDTELLHEVVRLVVVLMNVWQDVVLLGRRASGKLTW